MKNLWAPWRAQYILGPKADSCIFCLDEAIRRDGDALAERLILYQGRHSFVIMNKYPYNNGHIMIAPYAHVACVSDFTPECAAEFMPLLQECIKILSRHFKTHGMNIGFNLGAAAGAGVREHAHCHLVPRWNGDSNFMAVTAETRVISQHIEETYAALRSCFAAL